MKLLPEADELQELGLITEVFLILAYGYILFTAANLIGDGSERLLLLYGPGVVGGLVIPILGAIPDGAIIFFSGFGTDKAAVQEKIAVGVGTLVGSTVMLITIPFAATIWIGSRKLNPDGSVPPGPVRSVSWRSMNDGIRVEENLPMSSYIMMATSLTFLIIQIPAFYYISDKMDRIDGEHTPAFIGLCVSLLSFVGYSIYQLTSASAGERQRGQESEVRLHAWKTAMRGRFAHSDRVLKLIFNKFDTDNTNTIEPDELKNGLETLGLKLDRKDLLDFMAKYDVNHTFSIDLDEFERLAQDVFYQNNRISMRSLNDLAKVDSSNNLNGERQPLMSDCKSDFGSINNEDNTALLSSEVKINLEPLPTSDITEEEIEHVEAAFSPAVLADTPHIDFSDHEEEEEEFLALTDTQLRNKALMLLFAGTFLVTVFSDPMVEAMTGFAQTTGIPAFYVSFVISPLASNAAEVLASLRFAAKKSVNCVTLSLSSLYGAACMNNTFCLSIFFSLIWMQKLEWDFTAEVITNLFVIWVVGINGFNAYYRNWQGYLICSLYVISIAMIASLKFLDE